MPAMTDFKAGEATDARIPTIILLRGWMRGGRHWERFPDELGTQLRAKVADGATGSSRVMPDILCLDLPGNGSRYKERTPGSISEMVEAIRSVSLSEQPVVLIGISMGGMLAAEWLHQHPQEVAGFACINSSMRPHAYPWERLRLNNWLRILARLAASLAQKSSETAAIRRLERFIMQLTLSEEFQDESRLEQWVRWAQENPVSPQNALRQLRAAAAYKDPLTAPLTAPCLVLRSKGDGLVNPVCSERLAGAWQQELLTHPCAGHDLPVEDAHWLAEALASWYNSHWPLA